MTLVFYKLPQGEVAIDVTKQLRTPELHIFENITEMLHNSKISLKKG